MCEDIIKSCMTGVRIKLQNSNSFPQQPSLNIAQHCNLLEAVTHPYQYSESVKTEKAKQNMCIFMEQHVFSSIALKISFRQLLPKDRDEPLRDELSL
ncbi:hypothetical protein NPIL_477351 [Nephila pilipes]|uniref:Uncharacterized protein n=1 Tax=Nephila pilipes TaxID=299642 RepID=A0A8X6PUW5_NEPPI|nr:hypothetical protein NPIL_477351 [Nephila pilipes]